MNILLLMMGGSGTRYGADIPKQYIEIEEQPIFSYILKKYDDCECIDRTVIVTNAVWADYVNEWIEKLDIKKVYKVVSGGDTRSESVLNGLSAAAEFASSDDVVLIHDATHPYVDEPGTGKVIEAIKTYGGATLGYPQFDTVYQMDTDGMIDKVVPRQLIVSGASPEGFRFGDIYRIYTEATKEVFEQMTSAGAIALANGIPMKVILTDVLNLKITYQHDMELFKKLFRNYFFVR